MKNYKISIVTVTFNCKETIEETINSVLSQTYGNIEYIIVDGHSKDGTIDILKKYENRVTTLIVEKDNGIFDAMNKSLNYVSGDYVIFMNSGDKFVNCNVVSKCFQNVDSEEDIVYGDVYIQTNLGFQFYKATPIYLKKCSKRDLVFKSQGMCHQCIFTKSDVLKEVKFDLKCPIGADYGATYNVFIKGNHLLRYVGIPVAAFDDRKGGVSHTGHFDKKLYDERCYMFSYKYSIGDKILLYFIGLKENVKFCFFREFPKFCNLLRKYKYNKNI